MVRLFLKLKIKRELAEFKAFKNSFEFEMKPLLTKSDGSVVFDGVVIRQGSDGEWLGEGENFVNVGYKHHGALAKALSNLFPYEFYFRGHKVHSIESVFQSLKFFDKKAQKKVFALSGLDSNRVKVCSTYNWRKTGEVYFLGKKMNRFGSDYDDFIDELFVSALQNPLYRGALLNCGEKYILHAIGEETKQETLFSRFEFERELNCLCAFVKSKQKKM